MAKKILDWNEYLKTAAETVSEGIVMLKNDNGTLPIDKNRETAVFGRIQLHYYKSGTGSGGMVNVSKVVGITDGLIDCGAVINKELLSVYEQFEKDSPCTIGEKWGGEPWSQPEMPLEKSLAEKIAKTSETAIVVIGRTAGEEQDNTAEKGGYFLSDGEEQMMEVVRSAFKKMVVVLNVGGIIDMSFVDRYNPDAVLYVWHGGMTGGTGTADVLVGNVSPSGKLTDTIPYRLEDCPAYNNFGDIHKAVYAEDIYVGYRYFETFAKDKVRYPFGFGLSYTAFKIDKVRAEKNGNTIDAEFSVKNIGSYSGKEVVQLYFEAPQGRLGKPLRCLYNFEKTDTLAVGESETLKFSTDISAFASYDDTGVTGHKNCFVLEAGTYRLYAGSDVRTASEFMSFDISETIVVSEHEEALAPNEAYKRLKPAECDGKLVPVYEDAPLNTVDEAARRIENLPAELAYTGDKGIKLADVKNGKNTLDEFIAQLSDNDLACIIRGEGMGSLRVTPGTASAFGGVTDSLVEKGIPCGCCDDGPSGMRLDCGTNAFSIPIGTLIASTFNRKLITKLFSLLGMEVAVNKVECLLGPGMNIHRYPLNGRNFEYFSEDPFVTGTIAVAELAGLHSAGVTGTIKHCCCNNQELGRHTVDSVVSQRAVREIYLKGFEIAVKQGKARTIMTTYGSVNGLWTAGNFDLDTIIIRKDWGYDGLLMTDWWANINERGCEPDKSDFAAMARAQNDIYMCCADSGNHYDNTLKALEEGTLTRGELQRNAKNICRVLMETRAMDRVMGCEEEIEIINRPDEDVVIDMSSVECFDCDGDFVLDGSRICTDKGTNYVFLLDVSKLGIYDITVTGSSDSGELAQIPVSMFVLGTLCGSFTWNGTGGEDVSFTRTVPVFSRFTPVRLYFAQSGLKIREVRFKVTDK